MFSTKLAITISSISALIITVFCIVALNEMWVDFNNSMMMGCIPSEFNINEDIKAMVLMGAVVCYFISSLFIGIFYLIKPHNNKKIKEPNVDEFYAELLDVFKANFDDGTKYDGQYIKVRIDGLITRIRG